MSFQRLVLNILKMKELLMKWINYLSIQITIYPEKQRRFAEESHDD